jgi:hypothetical protein
MPFDPFFSSSNAKHYLEDAESEALWKKLMAMDMAERKKEMASWRGRELTPAEGLCRRKIAFQLRHKRRECILLDHLKTAHMVRESGLHTPVVSGYSTFGGHHGHQNRSFRSK